jgi:NADPH:quinone reductase-like Zn-dependent oxidoreductase
MVRKLGADHVIDYTTDDFTKRAERYDLVFDVPGNHSLAACRRVLIPDGKYVLIGHDQFGARGRRVLGSLPRFMGLMAMSFFVRQLPTASFKLPAKADAMEVLRELLEAGKLTPIVDRTFPLAEVPEAIRYLGEGNPRGKVVVTIP